MEAGHVFVPPHQRLSAKISGLKSLCSLCPFVAHYSFPISGLKSLCSLPLLAIRGEGQGEGHRFLHVFVPSAFISED